MTMGYNLDHIRKSVRQGILHLIGTAEKPIGEKIKVLYIAGAARSGSTLIDNLLGQMDGFFAGGEIQHIWKRGVLDNRLCGCGSPFWQCKTWSAIIQNNLGRVDKAEVLEWHQTKKRLTRVRRIFYFLFRSKKHQYSELKPFLDILKSLYHAIAAETECRVIVDSSKSPLYLCLLRLIPALDVYVIHLTRDPRAVGYSWMTPKPTRDPNAAPEMHVSNLYNSSLRWNTRNFIIELMIREMPGRFVQVRYEDFMNQPRHTLERILSILNETPMKLPFITETSFHQSANHLVAGNPSRLDTKQIVEINEDVRWKKRMSTWDKFVVSILTFPMRLYYKY
jgi:hypothetical protein